MLKKQFILSIAIVFSTIIIAQTNTVIIPRNIVLPKDSTIKTQFLQSLNSFLSLKDKPNKDNSYILPAAFIETSNLLDELKDIEKDTKRKDDHFYKSYLTNLIRLKDTGFQVQITYMGLSDSTPILHASFTFRAQKQGKQFYFYSPLKYRTANWKTEKIGSTTVYYKHTLNKTKATECFTTTEAYDKKLSAKMLPTDYYCCDNFQEALQLMGVDYKADYNGQSYSATSTIERDSSLIIDGMLTADFTNFDPHDLWHSRLHKILSTSIINKPVDEGTAYLYGGSWGLSWQQILDKFKTFVQANPNADWLSLYNDSKNFDEKAKYPLNVDFVINALIAQKLEKEKGFPAIIELLSCGKKIAGNENYFKALEKIAGISKAEFNTSVWALIKAH